MDGEKFRILKNADPEKLTVFRAKSLENEIRFYVNEDTYLVAKEPRDNKFSIELCKDVTDENEIQKLTFMDNLKFCLKLFPMIFFSLAIGYTMTLFLLFLATLINSSLLCFFIFSTAWLSFKIMVVVIPESITTSISLKSKHSAEHMMVNFLESYKRLPKTMEEIKKSSRFIATCGSRKKIKGYAENFLSYLVGGLLLNITDYFIYARLKNIILYSLILILAYIGGYILAKIILKKYKKLQFIVNALEDLFTNIVQCANTTRKVEDADIVLAYSVARKWIILVYPEFYDENEDTFLENCLNE